MKQRNLILMLLNMICFILFFSWRLNLLPHSIEKFVGNYGLHAIGTFGFTMMAILYANLFSFTLRFTKVVAIVVLTWVGSLVNEIIQYFDPSRVVDGWDVIAQTAGSLAALVALLALGYHRPIIETGEDLNKNSSLQGV